MPRGLIVIGDSVQRLNALYGQVLLSKPVFPYTIVKNCFQLVDFCSSFLTIVQGIAVSSKSAIVLSKVLSTALKRSGMEKQSSLKESLSSLGPQFQASLEVSTRDAWNFATKSDLMYSMTTTNTDQCQSMARVEESGIHALLVDAQKDAKLYCKLLEVIHLVSPPSLLLKSPKFWLNIFRKCYFRLSILLN